MPANTVPSTMATIVSTRTIPSEPMMTSATVRSGAGVAGTTVTRNES